MNWKHAARSTMFASSKDRLTLDQAKGPKGRSSEKVSMKGKEAKEADRRKANRTAPHLHRGGKWLEHLLRHRHPRLPLHGPGGAQRKHLLHPQARTQEKALLVLPSGSELTATNRLYQMPFT